MTGREGRWESFPFDHLRKRKGVTRKRLAQLNFLLFSSKGPDVKEGRKGGKNESITIHRKGGGKVSNFSIPLEYVNVNWKRGEKGKEEKK